MRSPEHYTKDGYIYEYTRMLMFTHRLSYNEALPDTLKHVKYIEDKYGYVWLDDGETEE